jgi:hypothetical protein
MTGNFKIPPSRWRLGKKVQRPRYDLAHIIEYSKGNPSNIIKKSPKKYKVHFTYKKENNGITELTVMVNKH